jgi:SOS response regulatory protein OraA/RecX
MSWNLRKGIDNWEIWEGEEKREDRSLPFLSRCPQHFPTLDALEEWLAGEEARQAKNSALRLLAGRNYPSPMLRRKLLEKGYREEIADPIVAWAEREGYVQNDDYLRFFLERELQKGHGPIWIRWKLRSQDLAEETIEPAIERILTPEVQKERIRSLLSKLQKRTPDQTIAALLRRGFSLDMIKDALRDMNHSR